MKPTRGNTLARMPFDLGDHTALSFPDLGLILEIFVTRVMDKARLIHKLRLA